MGCALDIDSMSVGGSEKIVISKTTRADLKLRVDLKLGFSARRRRGEGGGVEERLHGWPSWIVYRLLVKLGVLFFFQNGAGAVFFFFFLWILE